MPNLQPPLEAGYFQAPWEGFSACPPQSPALTQGKGGIDSVIALGLLNFCHSAVKEWCGFFLTYQRLGAAHVSIWL